MVKGRQLVFGPRAHRCGEGGRIREVLYRSHTWYLDNSGGLDRTSGFFANHIWGDKGQPQCSPTPTGRDYKELDHRNETQAHQNSSW